MQLNRGTKISEDYFNQVYPLVITLDRAPEISSSDALLHSLNQKLASVPSYADFVAKRFDELKLQTIQPDLSPQDLLLVSHEALGSLNKVIDALRAIGFTASEDPDGLGTQEKLIEIRRLVFAVKSIIVGGDDAAKFANALGLPASEARKIIASHSVKAA